MTRLLTSDIRPQHLSQSVTVAGWIQHSRHLGHIGFLLIRDSASEIQVVVDRQHPEFDQIMSLKVESVVRVEGVLRLREQPNDQQPLGKYEIALQILTVISSAKPLPFQIQDSDSQSEELIAKYRFLYLRHPKNQAYLKQRHHFFLWLRQYYDRKGYLEVQTPILTATSPEGARDFLVPSRRRPGHFYALPQSPQIFKQLLMLSGIPAYYQIAPCFRDEAARADRSPGEFYQLDVERSFVTKEDMCLEIKNVFEDLFREFSSEPVFFSRLSYAEAMEKYGSDKPDQRYPVVWENWPKNLDLSPFLGSDSLAFLALHRDESISRSLLDGLDEVARSSGWGKLGTILIDWQEGICKGSLGKHVQLEHLIPFKPLEGRYTLLVLISEKQFVHKGAIRKLCAEKCLQPRAGFSLVFVDDFPMFEWNEDIQGWDFVHNPFSYVLCDDIPGTPHSDIISSQYDLVCNGVEILSGAIRNHDPDRLIQVFEKVGYDTEKVKIQFNSLWTAFQYGAPPHGGYAAGLERLLMLLNHENNIRKFIPFPLTQQGLDPLCGAPSRVDDGYLKELGLKLTDDVLSTGL